MEDKELKHEFELERVMLFSDAVFAIILTIMVLDIKLPDDLKNQNAEVISKAFIELLPKFVAYIFSFLLIGLFWIGHLKIFKVLKDYTMVLVVYNLIFLFVISLFPFAISTVTGKLSFKNYWSVDTYFFIIIAAFLSQSLLVQYIIRHKHQLCFNPSSVENALEWRAQRLNYILLPIVIIIILLLNYFQLSTICATYVFAAYAFIMRYFKRRFYPERSKGIIYLIRSKRKPKLPAM